MGNVPALKIVCLKKVNKSFIPSNKSSKSNDSCKNMNTIHNMDYVGSFNDTLNVIFSSVSAFFPFSFKEAFRLCRRVLMKDIG